MCLFIFRQCGPPKLPTAISNHCDVAFTAFINTAEIVEIIGKHSIVIDVLDDLTQFCYSCNPSLHDMKNLIKMQELGISLDYRCPRYSSCNDCCNLSDTERMFVREELEDNAIRDSITIEYDAKKITVKLPSYRYVDKL